MNALKTANFRPLLRAMRRISLLWCGKKSRCGILAFALFSVLVSYAQADFRVCNATQKKAGVALGYRLKSGWVSEGWWQVEPSSCRTLIDGDLSSRFYYIYAEDADGTERWNGAVNMCVSENEFKIEGSRNCFPRGYQKFGFREIDTQNQTGWMVQLTDGAAAANADSGKSAAAHGGRQPRDDNTAKAARSAGQTTISPAGK